MVVSSMGPYLERLQALFLDSYDQQSLRELLLFKMDQKLADEVAEGESFRTVVFNLLVKALMEGWLLQLAQSAGAASGAQAGVGGHCRRAPSGTNPGRCPAFAGVRGRAPRESPTEGFTEGHPAV